VIPRWGAAVAAAGTTAAALAVLRRRASGEGWTRRNFRDRPVHLGAGPAATLGTVAAAAVTGVPPRACAAVAVAGGLGLYDDLVGGNHARGLRGHGRALARGEVTTGLMKMIGLLASGVAAAPARAGRGRLVARLADGALIAGTANLVNLLDLRPGRALKAVTLTAAPLAGPGARGPGEMATAVLATATTLLPGDLGERNMIGDCGANALGAALGWVLADRFGRVGRSTALATVVALTLVSERTSFSAIIDNQPILSALDSWGRQPL
jgi:UDP-GlcNAc:undecaprenyl-phosphate/decaprenyl-phosphate GlcNAc-1-phosphate transferase